MDNLDEFVKAIVGDPGVIVNPSPFGVYMSFINPFMNDMKEMEERRKEKLKAFWPKWENLQNLPRKKKKKEKRYLLLEYSILSWDPMKEMFNFTF